MHPSMPSGCAPRHLSRLINLATLFAATAAQAEMRLSIGAESTNASQSDAVVFDDEVKRASGYMFAGSSGEGGSIHEGGLNSCPALVCGQAFAPGATAAATVDMERGHLGVAARAWSNPPEVHAAQGISVLGIRDTISASGPLTFNLRINVSLNASQGEDSFARYSFSLAFKENADELITFFGFSAWDDPSGALPGGAPGRGAYAFVNRFWDGPGQGSYQVFEDLPSVFSISIVVPELPSGGVELQIYNLAEAESAGSNTASVSSLNSGYVGIGGNFSSAAGYNYTGFAAAVPEPASLTLWLAGIGLWALSARRRGSR